jgi:hypothetical protein
VTYPGYGRAGVVALVDSPDPQHYLLLEYDGTYVQLSKVISRAATLLCRIVAADYFENGWVDGELLEIRVKNNVAQMHVSGSQVVSGTYGSEWEITDAELIGNQYAGLFEVAA